MDRSHLIENEEKLLELIRRGDTTAFEILFKEHFDALARFSYSYVKARNIAKDVVQTVFLRIWEDREVLYPSGPIKNYLFLAVRNESINFLKSRNTRLTIHNDLKIFQQQLDESEEDDTEEQKRKELLENAIEQLPDRCKEIFILSRKAGFTYKEIAGILDISPKTVENQMTVAFKKLKEVLSRQSVIFLFTLFFTL